MGKLVDLAGMKFGRWTVIGRATKATHKPYWNCVCECGATKAVSGGNLRTGKSTSCGCLKVERSVAASKARAKHGMRNTSEYRIWMGIKTRCFNSNAPEYPHYGGRGITMQAEWIKDFTRFLADVGMRPNNALTLDRIDNNKGYTLTNVRWATKKEQANNMRTNLRITHGGRTMTLSEWADTTGVPYETLRWRAKHGKDLL